MNDPSPAPVSTDANRRKLIAMVVVGSCFAVMAVAFMTGGKKTPPIKDTEKDPAVGIVQEGADFKAGGSTTPDDWLNAPDGSGADTGTVAAMVPGKKESAMVAGDAPAASPSLDNPGQAGNAPATAGKPVAQGSATQSPPTSGTVADTSTVATAQPKAKPAVVPAATGAPTATQTAPQNVPTKAKIQRPGAPVFVRPKVKRPGLIAQTHALITHEELAAAAPQAAPPADPAQDVKAKPAPARVRQDEARTYAQKTTETFRQQGVLTPTQRVRLPRSTETASKKIWREEDKPATPDERRPFGLVVVEEKTPEGIPLRTDIPAGTSPLDKTGADKPLWKRPE
jgi:hypothetical protein